MSTLRELAERATPGPWYQCGSPWFQVASGVLAGSPDPHAGFLIIDTEQWEGERDEYVQNGGNVALASPDNDAAYIAAVSPDRILKLLDVADAAREMRKAREGTEEHFNRRFDLDAALAALGDLA